MKPQDGDMSNNELPTDFLSLEFVVKFTTPKLSLPEIEVDSLSSEVMYVNAWI